MSVVMITGCSTGFGLETALAFSRRGDTVYATMRNLDKSGELLVKRAEAEDLQIELLRLDVTDGQIGIRCHQSLSRRRMARSTCS